jgi:hypothetical protein
MFWRKKSNEGCFEVKVDTTRLDKIEERLKQLECEHFWVKLDREIVYYGTDCDVKCFKVCGRCGKKLFISKCEWLKEKHKQEKAIADATAKQLKECKP